MTISNGFTPKPKENCSLGVDIPLSANHYLVELKKEIIVFQYDVVLSHLDGDKNEKIFESKDLARYYFKLILMTFLTLSYSMKTSFQKIMPKISELSNVL
jgi:hypothetical protein